MDRGRMWERRGGYERVEVRRGEVRKWTDVPLQFAGMDGERGSACWGYRGWRNEQRVLLVDSWGSSGKTLALWTWKYEE
jgi:hypothetical protein